MSDLINANVLTEEDQNVLGEVCNISMGASAAALAMIIGHRVSITTPKVKISTWDGMREMHDGEFICVQANYKEGLSGRSLLVLKNRDAKIIADLMMGGTGQVEEPIVLSEMDISAISEAMNQMLGSAVTALTVIDNKKIDISTPESFMVSPTDIPDKRKVGFASDRLVAMVDFRIEISDLINSEVGQVMHLDTARELISSLKSSVL